jgi:hypothetical protein
MCTACCLVSCGRARISENSPCGIKFFHNLPFILMYFLRLNFQDHILKIFESRVSCSEVAHRCDASKAYFMLLVSCGSENINQMICILYYSGYNCNLMNCLCS